MENLIDFISTQYTGLLGAGAFCTLTVYMFYICKTRQRKRDSYKSGYADVIDELDSSSNKRLTYDTLKNTLVQNVSREVDVSPYWRGVSAALELYSSTTGQRLKGRKTWKL